MGAGIPVVFSMQLFPIWFAPISISFGAILFAIGIFLIVWKESARRCRLRLQAMMVFVAAIGFGRQLLAQCIRTSAEPDLEFYCAFSLIFYPAGLRLWTVRWTLVLNAIFTCASVAVLPLRVHVVGSSGRMIWMYVACGVLGMLMVYFQESSARRQFLLCLHLEQQNIQMMACQSNERLAFQARDASEDFLARMSHEIRTPLNGISGLIDLLLQSPLSPADLQLVNSMRGASDHLMAIVNDVLDLAKITAGKLSLKREDINIWQLPNLCIDLFVGKMKEKQLQWNVNVQPCVPKIVFGDKTRMLQILCNLLSNAIKFTPIGGKINLQVFRASLTRVTSTAGNTLDAENVYLKFVVSDTGRGMRADQQANLFTPYYQAESHITREQQGTGLGLSVVKELVDLMQGTIDLISAEGRGTTFTLQIPFQSTTGSSTDSHHNVEHHTTTIDWKQMTCLVVDDTPLNIVILEKQLARKGAKVLTAQNGQVAVDIVSNGTNIDVILMDLWMPILNGLEATQQVRTMLGSWIPIIGLTADYTPSVAQRGMEAGMSTVMLKPVKWDRLESAIVMHLQHRSDHVGQPSSPSSFLPNIPCD